MVLPCRSSCWIYYTAKSGGAQWLRESGFSLFRVYLPYMVASLLATVGIALLQGATSPTLRLAPVIYLMAIPHNSKCRYGERGAPAAKPKAQIILDAAKVSAASGGYSEPKQGQRSQSARGFCPEARCGYRNPTLSSILATQMPCRTPSRSEALRSATAACGGSWRGDPPERCLSRKAGIVRYCLINSALPGIRRLPQPPARRAELL